VNVWNRLAAHHLANGSIFNDFMSRLDSDYPGFLPQLQRSQALMVFSDFAGDDVHSRFVTFSFVVTPFEQIERWNRVRLAVRHRFHLGDRRMAYSKLNDRRRRAAISSFCRAANSIEGLSVTVLFDKRIKSIFTPGGYEPSITKIDGGTFLCKAPVLERALRAAFLIAIFLAGISAPGQNVVWVNDEDDIAANPTALAHLRHAFTSILNYNAAHSFGAVHVQTTGTIASEHLKSEDLAAIPDLIAGAVTSFFCSFGSRVPLYTFALAPSDLPPKAKTLILQLFEEDAKLKKLIFTAEPLLEGSEQIIYGFPRITFHPGLIAMPKAG